MNSESIFSYWSLNNYQETEDYYRSTSMNLDSIDNNNLMEEINDGIKLVRQLEGIDSIRLESRFEAFEKSIERKIYLHKSFSNHLIELNRQLRSAAALFVIGITFSALVMGGITVGESHGFHPSSGPYDLAMGSKVAP